MGNVLIISEILFDDGINILSVVLCISNDSWAVHSNSGIVSTVAAALCCKHTPTELVEVHNHKTICKYF